MEPVRAECSWPVALIHNEEDRHRCRELLALKISALHRLARASEHSGVRKLADAKIDLLLELWAALVGVDGDA